MFIILLGAGVNKTICLSRRAIGLRACQNSEGNSILQTTSLLHIVLSIFKQKIG